MKARITSDGGWFVDGSHLSAHLRAIVYVLDCERRRSWNQMDTAIEYTYKHTFLNSLQPRWCSGGFPAVIAAGGQACGCQKCRLDLPLDNNETSVTIQYQEVAILALRRAQRPVVVQSFM